MDNLTRPHIVLPNAPESLEFTSKSSGVQKRYSLIVSLEVPEQDVDIYTTVYNMVTVPVEIKV